MRAGTVLRSSLLIVALLGLPAHVLAAGTLYGSSDTADLFTIDPVTGAGTPVGVLSVCGGAFTTEIEYDNRTGVAFAQARDGAFCGQQFDITSASPVGLPVPDGGSFTGLETIAGIWYGTRITAPGGASELRTLDPVTGGSSLIGATGVGPIAGLAYDKATDTLYGIAGGPAPADLYTLDRDTGAATLVGSTLIQAGSLQFGPDGRLYAGGTGPITGGGLFVIDPATAATGVVGGTGFSRVTGLALRDADPCASLGNGGFEARNFTAWRTQDLAAPFFPLQVVGPGVNPLPPTFFSSSPTEGGFAMATGWDGNGPGTIVLAQDVTLPPRPIILQFDYRAAWNLKDFAVNPLPRTFSVDVEPAGGGAPLQHTLVLTAPSETIVLDTGSVRGSVDLTAFAGQRVRISFEWEVPEFFTGPAFFQLDNIHPLQASGLTVDAAGNGVLEPGEAVTVAPEWHNCSSLPVASLAGTASGFTGPGSPGVGYSLLDGAADYGTVRVGLPRDCATASANCYRVEIAVPATRPAVHWDAVLHEALGHPGAKDWVLHVGGSFTDVPGSNPFYRFVETLLHSGVTAGCTATQYCPGSTATREQMAVFLLRAKNGGSFTPPPCASAPFPDVPCGNPFAPWIQELVSLGVTSGCGGGDYCPASPVTREQMAVFLLKTREGAAFTPPACTTAPFADVPCSSSFAAWIQELAARGITGGCSATAYCPGDPVTREQMAVFLTRTFDLTLYGP